MRIMLIVLLLQVVFLVAVPPTYVMVNDRAVCVWSVPGVSSIGDVGLVVAGNSASVALLSDLKKSYLSMPREERIAAFADKEQRKRMKQDGWYPQPVVLKWDTGHTAKITLVISENSDMKEAVAVAELPGQSAKLHNLKIAMTYYCQVFDGEAASNIVSFTTEALPPRMIKLDGIYNFRDIGGRVGIDGKRIKQGEIYRCAALNDSSTKDEKGQVRPGRTRFNAATQQYFVHNLGIRTDLDLRNDKETAGMTGSPAGPSVKWVHLSSSQYQWMLKPVNRAVFAKDFRVILDPANRPVAFHCVSGQDRTGALAFLLHALLGVSEEELFQDWEFTGFWNDHARFCHERLFNHLYHAFDEFPGQTIQERAYQYALSAGLTPAEINEFREQMLE